MAADPISRRRSSPPASCWSAIETRGYAAQLDKEEGPLSDYLYGLLDTDQDASLSETEIRTALAKPWLSDKLSRLIARYESEWYADAGLSKWNALDDWIGEDGLEDWRREKERIQRLGWWKAIEALDGNGLAWHLHPLTLIRSFATYSRHPKVKIDGVSVELSFLNSNSGERIDDTDYSLAATQINCEVNAIKAVALVETGSSGSYFEYAGDDSTPSILFERHYSHRLTNGHHDGDTTISSSIPGDYGQYKDQYGKLYKAYELSPSAALRSASWGRFQIMGENFKNAGYRSVEEMVKDLSLSEKNHLKAFVKLVISNDKLTDAIRAKDWKSFAVTYNGPKQKDYDKRMRETYESLSGNR
ncbi:MAG: N-acetylmuramidase family protein [Pseudomonas oryzihabitans]